MHRENLTRRTFSQIAGLGIAAGTAAYLALHNNNLPDLTTFYPENGNILEIEKYNKVLINPPHPGLIKPVVNAAFSPYDLSQNIAQKVVQNTHKLGSNTVWLYIPNEFEPTFKNFEKYYIYKLRSFLLEVDKNSIEETGAIVNLKDFYNLLYRNIDNGLYKAKPLNDPAILGIKNPDELHARQKEVFTNQEDIDNYIERARMIIEELRPVKHLIRGWEVANEPDRPDIVPELNDWYSKVVPAIRDMDPDTPIISGLKNPNSIDSAALKPYGLDHNSAHVYGDDDEMKVQEYVGKMFHGEDLTPLLLLEHGVHRTVNGIRLPTFMHDYESAQKLRELTFQNIPIDKGKNNAYFGVYGFGLWQLDYSSSTYPYADSRDGFGILPNKYPKFTNAMQELSTVFSFN